MRAWIAAVLTGLLSCAGPGGQVASRKPASAESQHLENLRRAAQYPWVDEGACVVREADGDWRTLVERCYFALDLSRIQFRDLEHRCPLAQADAATMQAAVGICLLVQPELVVGVIIVIGVVVVASAIAAEIAKSETVARQPTDTKPCYCACLGRPDPNWNPKDPRHGDPSVGKVAYPAACREECRWRGFSNSQCR